MKGYKLSGIQALEYARQSAINVAVTGEALPDWLPCCSPDAPGLAEAVKTGKVEVEVIVPLHSRSGRKPLEELKPEARDLVGKISDTQVAKILGVSTSTVHRCRSRLGIPKAESKSKTVSTLEERIRKLEAKLAEAK